MLRRDQARGCLPEAFPGRRDLDILAHGQQTRQDALAVRLDDRLRLIHREGENRAGDVAADPRQGPDRRGIIGHHAGVLADDRPRRPVELPRPPVIAQALPSLDHLGFIGRGQSGHVGKTRDKSLEKGNDRGDGRLNQHHLRHEDAISIPARPPRQIPPCFAVPSEEPLPHCRQPSRNRRSGRPRPPDRCERTALALSGWRNYAFRFDAPLHQSTSLSCTTESRYQGSYLRIRNESASHAGIASLYTG